MAPQEKRSAGSLWSRIDAFQGKRKQDCPQDMLSAASSSGSWNMGQGVAPVPGQGRPASRHDAPAPGQDPPAPGQEMPAPQPGRSRSAVLSHARMPDPVVPVVVPMDEDSLPESSSSMSAAELEEREIENFVAATADDSMSHDDDLEVLVQLLPPEPAPAAPAAERKRARTEKKKQDAERKAPVRADKAAGRSGPIGQGVPGPRGRSVQKVVRGSRAVRGGKGGMDPGSTVEAASQAWQTLSPHRVPPTGPRSSPSSHRSSSPSAPPPSFSAEQPAASGSGRPGVNPGDSGPNQVGVVPSAQESLHPETSDRPPAAPQEAGDGVAAGAQQPVPGQSGAQAGVDPDQAEWAALPRQDIRLARLTVILSHLSDVSLL